MEKVFCHPKWAIRSDKRRGVLGIGDFLEKFKGVMSEDYKLQRTTGKKSSTTRRNMNCFRNSMT
jgi:hypothetical protein